MKSRKSSLTLHSFQDLKGSVNLDPSTAPSSALQSRIKGLLRVNPEQAPAFRPESRRVESFSPPNHHDSEFKNDESVQNPEFEEDLFSKAMEGVTPISRDNSVERICQVDLPEGIRDNEDTEILSKLADLVKYGKGFNVADTPEYIEGTGYHVPTAIAKRLHQGDYSIEAHIDLHGYNSEDAREMFEKFLKWAIFTGKKGVLIVHGRGLCSPSEPVLKKKVEEWLTRGIWRKWVVAYSSARICDGGAGATYVLLRGRPVSKRFKLGKLKMKKTPGCL